MFFCILLLAIVLSGLAMGYPVAFVLGGGAVITALLGAPFGQFDLIYLNTLPERIYGIMNNESLIAIALFVLMGSILEKSDIAKELLEAMGDLAGGTKSGLGASVFLVGALLAASTGIVGATVVTMGMISLPTLLKRGVSKELSAGIVAASGTLGQIIPPSIVLIVLGDVISTANQQAQIEKGVFNTTAVSVGDLFIGALIPGLMLVGLYILYIVVRMFFETGPKDEVVRQKPPFKKICKAVLPPLILVSMVLGSILFGVATPTEAASVGCFGAFVISYLKNKMTFEKLKTALDETVITTSMIFLILIGANILSVVFRGYGGDDLVEAMLLSLGDTPAFVFLMVMLLIFVLGFFLDFFEITFVVVPLIGPSLIQMGFDPVWLGVMIAMNLQTSFLTPPFGFSLFYLRGVAPSSIETRQIYQGVIPFIGIQVLMLIVLWFFPGLATDLPRQILGA